MKLVPAVLVPLLPVACLLGACTAGHDETPVIPADGVHITGAITGIYPIANEGTCPVIDLISGRELAFSANPGYGQVYFGAAVEKFTGPRTYTDVQWPSNGHSSMYVAFGDRVWRAESGIISVKSFGAGMASGTLWASHLRNLNGSTTVNAAGSWTCRLLFPPAEPSPSPVPSPIAFPTPTLPVGTPVQRQVLPPATVMPAVDLCSAPIDHYADGGAGPLFCQSGAINVPAWNYYAPIDPHLLSVGRNPTVDAVVSAMCADGRLHATNPMLVSGYDLGAAYYGWHLAFDPEQWVMNGSCP